MTRAMPDIIPVSPQGAIHEPFTAPEGVTMLAISHGPIGGYTDDGQLALMADARLHYLMARENGAVEFTTLVDYTHGSL